MKKLVFIITALLIFSACEPASVVSGRKLYKNYFRTVLKDPMSLEIHNEEYLVNGVKVFWEVDYSAKNSLGGRVRSTIEFETVGSLIVAIEDGKREYYDAKDLL